MKLFFASRFFFLLAPLTCDLIGRNKSNHFGILTVAQKQPTSDHNRPLC